MGYDIRQVTGPADYRAITELRYAVYASEEGLDIPGMDHGRRALRDPTDVEAIIFGVFDGVQAIATMSVTPMQYLGEDVRSFFGSAAFPIDEGQQALIGRLMVQAEHRGSPVCLQLFKAAYAHILRTSIAVGFVESSPRTIPLYESMGCRRYGVACGHPGYGLLVPMVLIADGRYLAQIRSPLSSLTPPSVRHADLSRWFQATHGRGGAFASVRAMSLDSFAATAGSLHAPGGLLSALDLAAGKSLLRQCSVLDIEPETTILWRDSPGTEMYLVLNGSIELIEPDAAGWHGARLIRSGGAFADGKFRWCDAAPVGRQTRALAPTRLLAISDAAFATIAKSHPAIATGLLESLTRVAARLVPPYVQQSENTLCMDDARGGLWSAVGRSANDHAARAPGP
jgi:hypothetical protein